MSTTYTHEQAAEMTGCTVEDVKRCHLGHTLMPQGKPALIRMPGGWSVLSDVKATRATEQGAAPADTAGAGDVLGRLRVGLKGSAIEEPTWVCAEEGGLIADCDPAHGLFVSEMGESVAAELVRRWNAYPELVAQRDALAEALEQCRRELQFAFDHESADFETDEVAGALTAADEALEGLARARGVK